MMKKIIMLAFILSILTILTSCNATIPVEKQCKIDTDCVPSVCCHATDSVNKANAPDCSETFCSLECKPGTVDCGQGVVGCEEGACVVILR
jgi:hypothetical protein